jgi:hypothetical protein
MGFTEVMIRIATPRHLCHPAKARASAGMIEPGLRVVADRRRVMALKWMLHLLFVRPAGNRSIFWRLYRVELVEFSFPEQFSRRGRTICALHGRLTNGLIMSPYRRLDDAFHKRRKQDEYSRDLSSEAPTSDGERSCRESFVVGRSR